MFLLKGDIDHNNVRGIFMRKKKNEEKDFEQKLSEVEFPECDDGHSKREKETIVLLKQIVNQNEQVIQLLTKLKERFI